MKQCHRVTSRLGQADGYMEEHNSAVKHFLNSWFRVLPSRTVSWPRSPETLELNAQNPGNETPTPQFSTSEGAEED